MPGVDDGSKDVEMSLELLRREYADKVTQIALTPHPSILSVRVCRNFAKAKWCGARTWVSVSENGSCAANEAGSRSLLFFATGRNRYAAFVFDRDLSFADRVSTGVLPTGAPDVLNQLTRRGIVPLIAHVERYAFVRSNPNLLCDLIESGAYTQMNATQFGAT